MSKRRKTTQSNAIPGQPKKTRLSKALGAAGLTRPNSETPAPTYFDFAPDAEQPIVMTPAQAAKTVEIESVPTQPPELAKTVEIERPAPQEISPQSEELPASSGLQPMTAPEPWLRMFNHHSSPSFPPLPGAQLPNFQQAAPSSRQSPGFQAPVFQAPGFQPSHTPASARFSAPLSDGHLPEEHLPEAPPPAVMDTLTLVDFKPGPVDVKETAATPETAEEPAPAPLPRRKTRMTLVQEFDITKLIAETETQSQKVVPIETVDDFNAAMHYFTGQAEGRTYTAELRFRASFTPIQDMKVTSEPEAASVTDDNDWIVADNVFSPAASEAPRVAPPPNSGFNMLDLIDESYRTIPANPTFSQSRQGQVGLSVDWSQPIAKLPAVQEGLMGGMSGNTKGNGAQYKNHWSKR